MIQFRTIEKFEMKQKQMIELFYCIVKVSLRQNLQLLLEEVILFSLIFFCKYVALQNCYIHYTK